MINQVICADCFDILPQIPDKSIKLCVADAPYMVPIWKELTNKLFPELFRIAEISIIPYLAAQLGKDYIDYIKEKYPPYQLIEFYINSIREKIYFLQYGEKLIPSQITIENDKAVKCNHSCPRPILWAEQLIKRLTDEGDLILDLFAGSGVISITAKKMNRKYIAIEIEPRHCEALKNKLNKEDL